MCGGKRMAKAGNCLDLPLLSDVLFMRWFARFFVIFTLAINMVWAEEAPSNLTLVTDKRNIKIWTYKVPNTPLSGFKATSIVKSSLAGLVGLITDTEHANRWLYRTRSIEVLDRSDDQLTFTIRAISDFPWPFTDREVLIDVRISQDSKTGIVRIDNSESAKAAKYPVKAGCLRMPVVQGYWMFKPLANGMVEITMAGHAHPGGNIPIGIVNLLVQEHPYNTLQGLRRVIGDARYQKMQYPGISEFANGTP